MQEEFDDLNKWPLKAAMKLTLGDNFESSIQLSSNECLQDKADDIQCGYCDIWLLNLDQHLHNNCPRIRIVGVQV